MVKFLRPKGSRPTCPICNKIIEGWERTVDQIEITSSFPVPDPNWGTQDSHGHSHWYWETTPHYATLEWIVDEPAWMDWPEEGHWECRQCHEPVMPGMIGPSPFRQFIPGMTHVYYQPCGHEAPNGLPPIHWVAEQHPTT